MVELDDFFFNGISRIQLLEGGDIFKFVVPVNAELIYISNRNSRLKRIINENYGTIDGQITYYVVKAKNFKQKFEVISGCDFIYDVAEYSNRNNKKIFLLGGYPNSNQKAVELLREKYSIQIEGYSPEYKAYPFDITHNENILKKISDFSPDFLFVGFGAPKQEFWIDDNKEDFKKMGIKMVICSGGTFEFVSGKFKKPSNFIKRMGLFAFIRLIQEPKLFRIKRIIKSLVILKYLFK